MDTNPAPPLARSHRAPAARSGDRTERRLAWVLVLLGSGLPTVVATTFGAALLPFGAMQLAALLAVVVWVGRTPRFSRLRGLAAAQLVITTLLVLGLHVLRDPEGGVALFTQGPTWRPLVAWQVVSTLGTGAMLAVPAVRRGRLLALGDLGAETAPNRLLNLRVPTPWRTVARDLAVVLTLVTAATLAFGGAFAGASPSSVLSALPLAAALAVVNATNEELQFRLGVVSTSLAVLTPGGAAIASGFVFGTWHVLGTPGGIPGVALTGFVGWLWARATIETRGLGVAVGLHVLQDLVIFTALLS